MTAADDTAPPVDLSSETTDDAIPSAPGAEVGGGLKGMLLRALRSGETRAVTRLLGPALRGFVLRRGRAGEVADMTVRHRARFRWDLSGDRPALRKLYDVANRNQWRGVDLPWGGAVDPADPSFVLIREEWLPLADIPQYRKLPTARRAEHRKDLLAWMLSQFLHGEQGALYAACQVTQAVDWADGKLFGSTQVMDEGRHVEVFHRYLDEALEKRYTIDDNLFTIVDALMGDSRWDLKFLGMQIMIEGLALGAFGVLRAATEHPLLRELLRLVIVDEARHVHFGVVALAEHMKTLSEAERREREDWAFEVAVLMRDRFLAREFYEEHYGHVMSRTEWERRCLASPYMERFRGMMFRRLVPNLKRIGLLTDRVRPRYRALGLLEFEHEKAADQIGIEELLAA